MLAATRTCTSDAAPPCRLGQCGCTRSCLLIPMSLVFRTLALARTPDTVLCLAITFQLDWNQAETGGLLVISLSMAALAREARPEIKK